MAENKKHDRILRRQIDFQEIKNSGKRFSPSPWLLVNYKTNNLGHLRYGFTISRKVGSAVVRNRLRRWSREFIRKSLLAGTDLSLDINVIFRPSRENFYRELPHSEIDRCLQQFFAKALRAG